MEEADFSSPMKETEETENELPLLLTSSDEDEEASWALIQRADEDEAREKTASPQTSIPALNGRTMGMEIDDIIDDPHLDWNRDVDLRRRARRSCKVEAPSRKDAGRAESCEGDRGGTFRYADVGLPSNSNGDCSTNVYASSHADRDGNRRANKLQSSSFPPRPAGIFSALHQNPRTLVAIYAWVLFLSLVAQYFWALWLPGAATTNSFTAGDATTRIQMNNPQSPQATANSGSKKWWTVDRPDAAWLAEVESLCHNY
ncbi:unnamed protein product, partial [Amoebophrya sp. A120]|eukprot:GSA120T00004396001.1